MRVAVRLFAGLRELAGARALELDLPAGAVAADVWPALDLGDEPAGLLVAINKSYAERGTVLADGDEVALIPPVSGGSFRLSELPLSLDDAVREVASDDAGAIATFTGTTRARSRGREVVRLEYEAYEGMAEAEMERIAADLKARHSLIEVAIHHRVGIVGNRRDERRHRRVVGASGRRARRLRRGDRHAQGLGAAVEEGDLRRRRGMDRGEAQYQAELRAEG